MATKPPAGDIFDLEFRCSDDDAWYSVRAILVSGTLTIQFENFPEISFGVTEFDSLEHLDEFTRRIRPVSTQLQDSECYKIDKGMKVCAYSSWREDDLRYYDAIVEAIEFKDHLFEKGEEECLCTFVLSWLHGPNAGNMSSSGVASICLVNTNAPLNSTILTFLKLAKENIKRASLRTRSVSKSYSTPTTTPDRRFLGFGQSTSVPPTIIVLHFESVASFQIDEDRDIGGVPFNMNKVEELGNHHYILIDNLEKDLSPTSVIEFIRKQTSITAEAYVFPSLLAESYTRGAIVLASKRSLEEIYKFLINPDHAIVSSTGRPWVITEEKMRRGYFKSVGSLMPRSQGGIVEDKLKVVRAGTEEFRKAARLKNLFKDFTDHQRQLHERLTLEHNKNLYPSSASYPGAG
ncbi:hypothetical protein DCAR_0522497 [Daucus carota subsp. sativus]|uniref:SAWADEE domain-containing protein n=1 Tax=Daucus carota subsp. sativus TaxID=79200 RepID=A0AAF0X7X4_DAUCS|nr:hypothetical protein DCAR_0522497 [Daucus carota subsp. sativus]